MNKNIDWRLKALDKFKKPNLKFVEDLDCIICFENLNTQINKIVKLPCKCSNNIYHIDCLYKFISSGENKNFCPHCSVTYELKLSEQELKIEIQKQILTGILGEQQKRLNFCIMFFHFVLNSIVNILSGYIITSKNTLSLNLKIIIGSYFLKLLINLFSLIYLKNNHNQIHNLILCSYILQLILFGFLFVFKNELGKIIFIYLVVFNLLFSIGDLLIRFGYSTNRENSIYPSF